MTLLAGFLGSGKTTTLQNLLANKDGLKIGIIVNDVASVNIDSKLLSNPNSLQEETIELQNGCACCSLADELLTSVEQLTDGGKREFDAIVVELSGVADPVQVKSNWVDAEFLGHPATKLAFMNKIVTLVDSSTFGTDWMTWDVSADREGWTDPNEACGGDKKVPELLAEQVEAADILIINKVDIAGEEQVKIASGLAKELNNEASLFETKFGEISIKEVFATLTKEKVVEEVEEKCKEVGCTDTSHDHSHEHNHHSHDEDESCSEPACTDASHDHSHKHDHGDEASASSCSEPACTDPTHSHSHSHDHEEGESCEDPGCTDPTHSHSHEHQSTSADKLGIINFVYTADRPFAPNRLLTILNKWPIPVKDDLDFGELAEAAVEGYNISGKEEKEKSAFLGVLRSKGFIWMAPTQWTGNGDDVWRHNTAMYWSHAGKHFGISTAGKWWDTITSKEMKMYFMNNEKEFDRIRREDFKSEEFGDRRQEIVFIGASINEEEITAALDACLLDDEEMATYRSSLSDFETVAGTGEVVKPIAPP
eukprot:CAMPEP_0194080098 /NCGR_PEP_ID=MMETSP0149-20130528/6175_1 /TAXON_ID=122233 /ORGANISM="Chaetoceros debilis, Strain MM31A-1" /LENGTH=537 /DNA_ID=CAMNT_0038761737 /DNA_START=231 /DNA_END=1844 /DNA_ORIENTATION=+